ncbi:MAG: 6-pyruvoyl-tetrahydropterin synthase related domain - membrane protein [Microgenomates bacterium OLB22]|nr:MAG: 6-pyruvoyl-tetrahydropterin synthase related domain - membrane protein [Microgenomates bacterium OLB22]
MMKRLLHIVLPIIGISALIFPTYIILLSQGYPTMHDDQHIARMYALVEAMAHGQWYGRWVQHLVFGLGYPLFNFYPPLTYYISLPFYLLTQEFISSIKLMMLAGLITGAYGTYLFAKEISNKWVGIVAAILYGFFPYRAVLTFVRGAFADFWAVSLSPFVYWAILRLSKKVSLGNCILLGICVGLVILSHQIQVVPMALFGIPIVGYCLFTTTPKKRFVFLQALVLSGVIGLGTSAFFTLPLFLEKSSTLVDVLNTSNLYDFHLHFVLPSQLWYSPWGYGGSVAGSGDGMSFQIGKLFIGGFLLAIGASLFVVIKKRKTISLWLPLISLLSIFVLIMTTSYSQIIWETLPFLYYVQFPWRLMGFANIFIPVSIALASRVILDQVKLGRIIKNQYVGVSVVVGISLLFGYKYGHLFRPQEMRNIDDEYMTSENKIKWEVSKSSFEFAPNGISLSKTPPYGNLFPPIREKDIPIPAVFPSADVRATVISRIPNHQYYHITNTGLPTRVRLGTFNFPGWQAKVNDKLVTIYSDNPLQLIEVVIPSGESKIELFFTDTLIRVIGNTVSLATWTLIGMYFLSQQRSLGRGGKQFK